MPRDAAFWATYNAVQAENARAFERVECSREGHEMRSDGRSPWRCRCGLDEHGAAWDLGYVLVPNPDDPSFHRMVWVGDIHRELDQEQTEMLEFSKDGVVTGSRTHLVHRETGLSVTVEDSQPAVGRARAFRELATKVAAAKVGAQQ